MKPIDKRQLKSLSERSDARGLAQLAGHLALIALSGTAVWWAAGSLGLVLLLPLHGIFLTFLFAPLHECIHRTAFRSRRLNDAVAFFCGAVLLLPSQYFRAFHLAHHRFTQDPARDPELAVPRPATKKKYLWHVSGLPYWWVRAATTVRQALGQVPEDFVPNGTAPGIVREARVLLLCYGALVLGGLLSGSWAPVLLWLAPVLIGQPALRLFLLAEHWGCPMVCDMLRNSRTTRTTGFLRWLTWNMSYHVEHHAYPAVPFHALPKAHAFVGPHIATHASGYGAVHREIWHRLSTRPATPVQGARL